VATKNYAGEAENGTAAQRNVGALKCGGVGRPIDRVNKVLNIYLLCQCSAGIGELLYKINALQSLTEAKEFKVDFNTKLPLRQSFSWLTEITVMIGSLKDSYTVVSGHVPMYVKCTIFLHGSRTVVMIMIRFKCLGSSCLDLGLASAPDCFASVSTSLPRSRSCLASVLAVAALSLPLPRKFCLGICLCLEKNALTTTLRISA